MYCGSVESGFHVLHLSAQFPTFLSFPNKAVWLLAHCTAVSLQPPELERTYWSHQQSSMITADLTYLVMHICLLPTPPVRLTYTSSKLLAVADMMGVMVRLWLVLFDRRKYLAYRWGSGFCIQQVGATGVRV